MTDGNFGMPELYTAVDCRGVEVDNDQLSALFAVFCT